jgi:hypothetical protein
MKNTLQFNGASQRVAAGVASTARFAKRCAPLALLMWVAAVRCYAAASPLAKLVTDVAAEATGTWAVAGAGIGLVTGIIGMKMDGSREVKGAAATLAGLSFLLLSVNAIVAYLQAE